jgi:hypothetical protein
MHPILYSIGAGRWGLVSALLVIPTGIKAQEPPEPKGQRVEQIGYSVRAPLEKGWKVETNREGQAIVFQRTRKFLLEKVQLLRLLVMRDSSQAEHWPLPPGDFADSLRAQELAIMQREGVANRQYELKDVRTAVDTIAGKELYSLRFQKVLYLPERWREDGTFYLFFPADYGERHVFYSFLLSDFYKAPTGGHTGVKHAPEVLDSVVASLRLN